MTPTTDRPHPVNTLGRKLVTRIILVTMLFLAWQQTPIANAQVITPNPAPAAAPETGGTFVVGDSTTWQLTGEKDNTFNLWAARHPDWTVDGLGGRSVAYLPARIQYHLTNIDANPDTFVMALGTNPPPSNGVWTKADYVNALNLLPPTTKIVLVLPVRAARRSALQRAHSDKVTQYAKYLQQIANTRPNTVIANWRQLVLSDPKRDPVTGIGTWLVDGVHARNPHGRAKWMDLVDAAYARLHPTPPAAARETGGTFVVGDSTTWQLTGEKDNTFNLWAARHPDWTVDGLGGRSVIHLPARIQYHLTNIDANPDTFVMALGTNPPPSNGTWTKADYTNALNLLPPTTNIVLVLPVRAARNSALQRSHSDKVTQYAKYLQQIANTRPNTVIANWRQLVLSDPKRDPVTGIGTWLVDGVHARNPHGRAKWMDLVDAAYTRLH